MPTEPTFNPDAEQMNLSNSQKRYLRGLGHAIKPLIQVGKNGITDALIKELGLVLDQHELVKVKLATDDRQARRIQMAELEEKTQASLVQTVGKVACYYRRNQDQPKLALPT